MKIECQDKTMAVLELSYTDMQELSISYGDICDCDEDARRAVNAIMDRLFTSANRRNCHIYAFPDVKGGCMLFFLFGDAQESTFVFETADSSALIDGAAASMCAAQHILSAGLYTLNGVYRLVVRTDDAACLNSLYEFTYCVGGMAQARTTDEYWTLLCADDALHKLACRV